MNVWGVHSGSSTAASVATGPWLHGSAIVSVVFTTVDVNLVVDHCPPLHLWRDEVGRVDVGMIGKRQVRSCGIAIPFRLHCPNLLGVVKDGPVGKRALAGMPVAIYQHVFDSIAEGFLVVVVCIRPFHRWRRGETYLTKAANRCRRRYALQVNFHRMLQHGIRLAAVEAPGAASHEEVTK